MTHYLTVIENRIAGIPCKLGVTSFTHVDGSYNYNAVNDFDYYGYSEVTWDVLDRRGRPAPWLEKKLTEKEIERINMDVVNHIEGE